MTLGNSLTLTWPGAWKGGGEEPEVTGSERIRFPAEAMFYV